MLRKSLIGLALTMVLFAGWLFSDDLEKPDLTSVIKNIQHSLQQIQSEITDLRSSVKQLSHAAKKEKETTAARSTVAGSSNPAASNAVSPWQRAQEAYDRGKGLEEQKLCGQAIEAFTRAIELDSKNDSAYLHRGACRNQLGNYPDAVSDLTASLALQPNNSQAYALRAAAFAGSGQTPAALADASEAIRRNSTNVDNYLLRASLHQRAGEVQPALDDYTQAIAMAPQSEKAYLGRAALLRSQNQLVGSVKDCYKAIELNPGDPAAYLCRAEFYLASGAAQPAIADINQALMNGQNPAQASTLLSSAKQILATKDAGAQQTVAVVAAPAAPSVPAPAPATPPAPAPAASAPVASIALPPAGMPSPGTLTQSPAATPALPKAVAAPPVAPPRPPINVEVVASRSAPPHAAAAPRAAASAEADVNSVYRQGRRLAEQERFAEALPLFDQAIQLNPGFTLAYNARCYANLRLKQYDQAIADCTEAIRLDASYANAYQNRSVARHYLGDRAGSSEDAKRASALQPVAQVQTQTPSKQ